MQAGHRERALSLLAAVAAGGVPLALYVSTVAPTIYGLDSAELTTGAYALGIVHPPGSPAYLLIAHAFTWLPFGDVAYRVNLLSACANALSIAFLYAIIRRLGAGRLVALATSWFTAFSFYVWLAAVAAEIYALAGSFALGLVALALRWLDRGQSRLFCIVCFLAGLGLGVHLSLVLLLPGLALLALGPPQHAWRRPRLLLAGALFGLIGLSVYLYLPLRAGVSLNMARDGFRIDLRTWEGFWWMVTARPFAHYVFGVPLAQLPESFWQFAQRLWSNFFALGTCIGVVGIAAGLRRLPRVHVPLLLMAAAHAGFYVTYAAKDVSFMFLPVYLLWGIWIAGAAVALARWRRDLRLLTLLLLFGMAATAAAVNRGMVDVSDDWSGRRDGEKLLSVLPENAIYFGSFNEVFFVQYLQQVENQSPGIVVREVLYYAVEKHRAEVANALATGRPVYARTCEYLDQRFACDYVRRCDCYRVSTTD